MLLSICDKSSIMEVMLIVKTFFKLACLLAPFLVMFASIVGIFKIVQSGKEDELKDYFKVSIKRLIAGIFIFFIPTIINYAYNGLASDKNIDFLVCLETASKEKVAALKAKEEAEAEADKKAQEKEDEALLKKAWEEEQKQKGAKKQSFEEWKNKKEEEERLKILEQQRQQQQQQQQSSGDGSSGGGGTTDGTVSTVKAGENGVSVKQFNASNGISMKYWEVLPTNTSQKVPLIIFLHGSGETNSVNGVGRLPIVSYVSNEWDRNSKPFIFLAPVAPSSGWSGKKIQAVKGLIDNTISQYNVDTNHIIITGMSMGGYGTWNMLAAYGDFFSAAVPMSGCASSSSANYAKVPIRAIVGGQESNYKSCMTESVNKINQAGGRAQMDVKDGASHSTIQRYYKSSELFNWMLSQ